MYFSPRIPPQFTPSPRTFFATYSEQIAQPRRIFTGWTFAFPGGDFVDKFAGKPSPRTNKLCIIQPALWSIASIKPKPQRGSKSGGQPYTQQGVIENNIEFLNGDYGLYPELQTDNSES
jgi:hypothetical protein